MTISITALVLAVSLALSLINDHRVDSGCGRLAEASRVLRVAARQHSQAMADAGYIFHSELRLGRWSRVGEVIGVGATVRRVVRALFRSDPHRRILLDCRYDKIAIGIYRDSRVWLTARLYDS